MTNFFVKNKKAIIRVAFLIPILSVAAISISHVVRWYDLANPISWAVYLSIAIEIAAMSAIAASSVKVRGFSVWFVFIIVTLIQFIGNIYFSYSDIDVSSKGFKDWVDLTSPIFESIGSGVTDTISQRRWLALLEGGLLPLISLTCLHFFIKYGDIDDIKEIIPVTEIPVKEEKSSEETITFQQTQSEPEAIEIEKSIEEALNFTETNPSAPHQTANHYADRQFAIYSKESQIDNSKKADLANPKASRNNQ